MGVKGCSSCKGPVLNENEEIYGQKIYILQLRRGEFTQDINTIGIQQADGRLWALPENLNLQGSQIQMIKCRH